MAGRGSRFVNAGVEVPKPLIDIDGHPMIEWAIRSFGIDGRYLFIVQKDHINGYGLDTLLRSIVDSPIIIPIDYITEGQACSVLLAEQFINNNDPVVSTNCDQIVDWNVQDFLNLTKSKIDGVIPIYKDSGPKWSYAAVDENGFVTQTAEKIQISDNATVGTYYWSRGKDLVKYTNQMITKNKRVNNEFYSCPVYNEAIEDGLKIKTFQVNKMLPVGTPEDLTNFLNSSYYKHQKLWS